MLKPAVNTYGQIRVLWGEVEFPAALSRRPRRAGPFEVAVSATALAHPDTRIGRALAVDAVRAVEQ